MSLRPRIGRAFCVVCVVLTVSMGAGRPAAAGPPYVTDDPEPTRTGGWENYVYATGTDTPGETAGQGGIELNYGAAKNLQLSASLPLDYDARRKLRIGAGDLDLGAKYRFLHPSEGGWLPDAAVFPSISLPTAARGFDTGHPTLFLPIWLQKDRGKWSTFGGGGYTVSPGRGQRDSVLVGWALTRSFSKRLNLGVEIYHQTPTAAGGSALTNVGVGANYQLTKHWGLLATGGPGLQAPSRSGTSAVYASLQFTN